MTQTLLLLLAALTATLIATGLITLWMLFVIAAVTGCVSAPDGTARQVYVVDLVGTERLASAVSLYEVVLNISRVVGPGVGGALLATVGVGACCALNAASYLQPLFVLLRHRPRQPAAAPAAPTARKAPPGQLRAGLRYAWRNRPIRVSLFLAASSGLLFNLGVTLPLLATRVFHLGGGGYGLMMAVFGIGALPGALFASAGSGRPTGRSVGVLALATAAAVLGTAAAPALWLVMVGLAVTGCLSIWFIAQANTLVQLVADPSMRGRVMGLWTMALPGTEPATSPRAGSEKTNSAPPEYSRTQRVSGRCARVSAMRCALPGDVCSRTSQSTQPARGASMRPNTRSPAVSASRRYRRATVWSETPSTPASWRNDPRGATIRTRGRSWRSTSSS